MPVDGSAIPQAADVYLRGDRLLNWTIDYLPAQEILRVTVAGELTPDALATLMPQGIAEAARRGARRTLLDYRAVVPAMGTMDIYRAPDVALQSGLSRDHRVAFVIGADPRTRADFRFYEDRAVLTGMNHRTFDDIAPAIAWLVGEDSAE